MFTKKHFERYLRTAWANKGYPFDEHERVGISIDELVAHSMQRNAKLDMPYVDLWIAILDEQISWFVSMVAVFYGERDKDTPMSAFEQSVLMLLSRIIADSTAIRHLILLGFDSSARTVLRSLSEYMEVLVAILHKPEFSDVFEKSDTPEAAQEFWQRHLRGGKLRRRVTEAWEEFFGSRDDVTHWFADWGRSQNGVLSGTAHPSFAGGLFSSVAFKAKHVEENWLGLWGDKSDRSADTVLTYLTFAFPILLLSKDFPFDGYDEHMLAKHQYDDGRELHRHVRVGREIMASLILSLGSDVSNTDVHPELDLSFLPDTSSS